MIFMKMAKQHLTYVHGVNAIIQQILMYLQCAIRVVKTKAGVNYNNIF